MIKKTVFLLTFIYLAANTLALAQEALKSTIDDQTSVEVTVYNSNLGLVKDTRKINLPKAQGKELRFMDVAEFINPVTVHVKSLNNPENFFVLEQNYEYDLMNDQKLLDKYVGKNIKLMDKNQYQDTTKIVDAILLSNNNGQIYKIGNEIYLGHPGIRILPEIPENMIAQPTLTWLYSSGITSEQQLQVSYLTQNISWLADYILVVDKDDKLADLSGWVSVDNRSGATYKEAKLKLVAGEVHQAPRANRREAKVMYDAMELSAGAPQFQEKGLFEYHMYDLQRPTTIKNNQTKQISLLEASNVAIEKEMIVEGNSAYYISQYSRGGDKPKEPVNVYIKFKNEEKNKLGMPLPAGVIRLYKKDDTESLQFIGEDRIEHTPKDEEVKLMVGKAFDVVAERVQTDFKRLSTQMYESTWEITLRNHKKEDVVVTVIEPLPYNQWNIVFSSQPFEKKDAFTAKFKVSVPKDKEVKLTYTTRVGL